MMRRILLLVTVALVMAAMMLVMAMPALAFHTTPSFETHPLITGECGKGKCTGFGFDENWGRYQNNENGDVRNDVCFEHGACIGTNNN